MSARLRFPDAHAAADVATFAGRAGEVGAEGVRLQAGDGVLAMSSAVLAPRGLLDATPTILAMRVLPVDPELSCDLVVEASTLRVADDDAREITLPETAIAPAWAGIAPPRGGWEEVGRVTAAVLAARANHGIAAVADALPASPGEDVARAVRARVWGAPADDLLSLPSGAAFAAFGLGFISGDEDAVLRRSGAWSRLTLQRGHVLVRGPVRSGLTPVRATGR